MKKQIIKAIYDKYKTFCHTQCNFVNLNKMNIYIKFIHFTF